MKTLRNTSAVIGTMLLLAAAPSATAAPLTSPTAIAVSASAAQAQAQAPGDVTTTTSYGARPITLTGKRARITFAGRKGDIVHLDAGLAKRSTTRLLSGGRAVKETWNGFWKLPRAGRYTFVFTEADQDRAKRTLQLQKVRVAKTKLDAAPVAGRTQQRGYLNAVAFNLRDGQRALMSMKDRNHMLLLPGGGTESLLGKQVQLEPGKPVTTTLGDLGTAPLSAGQVIVLGKGTKDTNVTRSVVKTITTDGAPVEFTSDSQPREYLFSFNAAAGDVVIPDFHGTREWDQVMQPAGGAVQSPSPGSGAYWFFGAGTATYSVVTSGTATATTRLSLSKALVKPAVTDLAAPITLANTKPGEYVAIPVGGGIRSIAATDATFTTTDGSAATWSVHLEPAVPVYCQDLASPPMGCGEYFPLTVDQSTSSDALDPTVGGPTGDSLVLAVPPTVSGKVTITLK